MTGPFSLMLRPLFRWLWKNYQYVLAFLFAIEEINKDSHLLPNLSLGFNLYNAFPSDQRTLESALFGLSGGNQTLPNYNCQRQRKSVAIVTGTALAFFSRDRNSSGALQKPTGEWVFNSEEKSLDFHQYHFPSSDQKEM